MVSVKWYNLSYCATYSIDWTKAFIVNGRYIVSQLNSYQCEVYHNQQTCLYLIKTNTYHYAEYNHCQDLDL